MTTVVVTPTVTVSGVATVLSSISHGEGHEGTDQLIRRERVMTSDGPAQIPVVSGQAWRGKLRRVSAWELWRMLDRPDLPATSANFLLAGGSLAKTPKPITDHEQRRLREICPMVDLFGGSGGGTIMEGCLQVGKLTPLCAETRALLGHDAGTPARQLVQLEEFSRKEPTTFTEDPDAEPGGIQMRYGVETLVAGTRLDWWMRVISERPATHAWAALTVQRWVVEGAHVGGRSATGHGRLHVPELVDWAQAQDVAGVAEVVAGNRDEIVDLLGRCA